MLKLTNKYEVVKPTDFNIIVQKITDRNGATLDLETASFHFEFFDSATLATIEAERSPNPNELYTVSCLDGVRTNNTFEDGVLTFQFENYPFSKGKLCYRQVESYENSKFSDNNEDIVTIKTLPIEIKTSGANDLYSGDCFATVSIGALRGEKGDSAEDLTPKFHGTTSIITLQPNTLNSWSDDLAIVNLAGNNFTDWAESDEVVIQLLSGDSACDLSLPDSIIWLNDSPTTPESNALYILSIKIIGGSPIAVGGVAYV